MKFGYDMTPHEAAGAIETFRHKARVAELLSDVSGEIRQRAIVHDNSKVEGDALTGFGDANIDIRTVKYGGAMYEKAEDELHALKQAHYKQSRHHPEFYTAGIGDMGLLDLIEMLADWKAANERVLDNGKFVDSMEYNRDKFCIPASLMTVLFQTALGLGWISNDEAREATNG